MISARCRLVHTLFPTLCAIARARRIYCIRHERLLRAYEKAFYDNVSQNLNWTQDDITELLSLTVTRKLESARRHVREVKQARRATEQLKVRLAKGDTE